MSAGSTIELSFITMRAGRPASAWPISRSMSCASRWRSECGATRSLRYSRCRESPVRKLKRSVTSAAISGRTVKSPRST